MEPKNKPASPPDDMSREIEAFIKQLKEEEKRQAAEDQRLGPWLPPEPEPIVAPQRRPPPTPSARSFSPPPSPSPQLEAAEQQIQTKNKQIKWLIFVLTLLGIWSICPTSPSSQTASFPASTPTPTTTFASSTPTALWHMASAEDARLTLHKAHLALDNHNSKEALVQAYQALSYGIVDNDLDLEQEAYTVLFDAVHQTRLLHRLEGPLRGFFHPHGMLFAISEGGYVSIWNPRDPHYALTSLSVPSEGIPTLIFNEQGTHALVYEARTVRTNQDVVRLYALNDEYQSLIPIELELALHHTEMAVFSPDGTRLLTTYGLWHVEDGRLIKQLASSEEKLYKAVGFNHDGSRFFTLTETGEVFVWSGEGVLLSQLPTEGRQTVSVQFNAQGTHLFTVSNRSVAQIWDESGALVGTLAKVYAISHTAFSPDATRLVTADGGQTLRFWDREGQLLQAVDIGLWQMDSMVFSPDGAQLLTVGCLTESENSCVNPDLRLWDGNGRLINQLHGHRGQINSAVFSPDSQYILTTSADLTTQLWYRTGELKAVLPASKQMHTASFSPDGAHIVTLDEDGQTWLWKTHALPQFLAEHKNQANLQAYSQVNLLAYSQDGSRLLTASTTGRTAYLWDADGRLLFAKNGIDDMTTIAMNPQGTRFVLGQTLWNDQGLIVAPLENLVKDVLLTAQFSADGSRLLTTYQSGVVNLWNGQDGTLLTVLENPTPRGALNSAEFNHDGTRILNTKNSQKSPFVYDADGNRMYILHTGRHPPRHIQVALFSHDSEFVLIMTQEGRIELWDKEGQILREQPSINVTTAALNRDDTHFFTANDSYVHLWALDSLQSYTVTERTVLPFQIMFNYDGTHLLILEPQGRMELFKVNQVGSPTSISNWSMEGDGEVAFFSPLGSYIFVGDSLGMGYLLNDQGNFLMEIQTHAEHGLNAAAFHPSETYFVTPSGRDRARIWMPIDLLLAEAERQLGLILTQQECQIHFGDILPRFCPSR